MKKKQFSIKQIVIRELPYVVIHVLIKNKLLTAYLNNSDFDLTPNNMHQVFDRNKPENAIMHGFIWIHTPEGLDIWSSIYQEVRNA